MSNEAPYIGEMRIFSFTMIPPGWASCEGQELSIQQNLTLFSLLGTAFGGNGSTTFHLPDLRARVPMHAAQATDRGRSGGEASHTLHYDELPRHNHQLVASDAGPSSNAPGPGLRLSNDEPGNLYGAANNLIQMNQATIGVTGGSKPHENRQPFLALNICICLGGEYPPKTTPEDES